MLFQAVLFFTPRIIWKSASLRSGLNVADLVQAAYSYKAVDKFDTRDDKYMRYLVTNFDQYVDDPRRYEKERPSFIIRILMAINPFFGRYLGNYLIILYFVTKLIYLANVFMQILLLSGLLGYNFFYFGTDFITKLIKGEGWITESKYFPKTALCDFKIREMGNPKIFHRYTVQCVLSINLFNQQIFTVIWFWYIVLIATNISELIKWIVRSIPSHNSAWIERRVRLFDETVSKERPDELDEFIRYYLEPDGIFMLRLIANNVSDYVASNLIQELWRTFTSKPQWRSMRRQLDNNESSNGRRKNVHDAYKSVISQIIVESNDTHTTDDSLLIKSN